jgi:hypothetical protein
MRLVGVRQLFVPLTATFARSKEPPASASKPSASLHSSSKEAFVDSSGFKDERKCISHSGSFGAFYDKQPNR